jgi:ABC-type antimicrobial peptide transport system permease subunit
MMLAFEEHEEYMARVLSQRQRNAGPFLPGTVFLLATRRLRRTSFLLVLIALGMLAAVVIVCSIPLYSGVMTTASLRNALRSTPEGDQIVVYGGNSGLSTPIIQEAYNEFAPLFQRYLGNTVQQAQSSITINNDFSFSPQRKNTILTVYGTAMQLAAPHFGKVDGRLAQVTNQPIHELEVMMTPATAKDLGMHVGSTFALSFSYSLPLSSSDNGPTVYSVTLLAHLVGLFQVTSSNMAYWHGDDFNPLALATENTPEYQYTILVPQEALLAFVDRLAAIHQTDSILSLSNAGYAFTWYYHFLPSRLSGSDLPSLINNLNQLQSTISSLYTDVQNDTPTHANMSSIGLSGSVLGSNGQPGSLALLQDRVDVARIPAGIFSLLIILLILFFVSLMTALLVDHQLDAIALLRSRGASRGQIIGAFFLQNVILSLLAVLVGLPLAIYTTLLLAKQSLPGNGRDALDVITAHLWQAMAGILPYAFIIMLVALITTGISLFSAVRMDVLALRRTTARSSTRPLWQRFNLDLIAGTLALLGYGLSVYVTSINSALQADARALIVTPLSILAPFFLMLGCLLFFFRFYPILLRWAGRLAERGRGAVSLLALAQVARSPRQALRMALLLALATAFTCFTLVYSATEARHIQDIANYETGADFSAHLFASANSSSLSRVISQYSSIPGVLSASAGYSDQGYGGHADLAMEIRAVDPASFGRTVIWPSQQAYLQASPLLAKLASQRQFAITNDVIPAIVDSTTLQALLLQVGSTFTIAVNNVSPKQMHCLIIGVIDHIPTVNTLTASAKTGGVLVDYQTYLNVFTQDVKQQPHANPVEPPLPNQVWLHTKSDPATLERIRLILNKPASQLNHIVDRYLLLATLQSDPLYLILTGVLGLGTITALLLALIGDLLASWVSVRTRLVNFASLRAFGATAREIGLVFLWEQGIIYVTGLLLGAGLAALLILSVLPQLTFTNIDVNLVSQQFFALQSALATQIVIPPTLLLALLVFVCICGITLLAMIRIVTRPLLNQTLRLNED